MAPRTTDTPTNVIIAVHGGAGADVSRPTLTDDSVRAHHEGLRAALQAGLARLEAGESALDAVQAAVQTLEDNPIFNAGRGASLSLTGRAELDAAIMDGATGNAGAVAGVTRYKNPIHLARLVMEKSPHVFLVGSGVDEFADALGLPSTDNDYFRTPGRLAQWERLRHSQVPVSTAAVEAMATEDMATEDKVGTVGAVARDKDNNIAAATSTGGMAVKRWGRVGDSPVIGAGTWADNRTCAISATGHGEYFIRVAAAHDIAARMAYAGASVSEAASAVIHDVLYPIGGEGGLIALDAQGNAALPFNTPGMFRGWVTEDGSIHTAIFPGE